MKKLAILSLLSVSLIGCTTYPKAYTYSPTINISGSDNDVLLPGPFSKKSPKAKINKTRTITNYDSSYSSRWAHNYVEPQPTSYSSDRDFYSPVREFPTTTRVVFSDGLVAR